MSETPDARLCVTLEETPLLHRAGVRLVALIVTTLLRGGKTLNLRRSRVVMHPVRTRTTSDAARPSEETAGLPATFAEVCDQIRALLSSGAESSTFSRECEEAFFPAADRFVREAIVMVLHLRDESELATVLHKLARLEDETSIDRAIAVLSSLTYLVDERVVKMISASLAALELLVEADLAVNASRRRAGARDRSASFTAHLASALGKSEMLVADITHDMDRRSASNFAGSASIQMDAKTERSLLSV